MRNFVLSWKLIIIPFLIIGVVVGIQYLAHNFILDITQKHATMCTFAEWERYGDEVVMKLQCEDGEEGTVSDNSVVIGYLRDPGPLECRRFESGRVLCEVRGQTEEGGAV